MPLDVFIQRLGPRVLEERGCPEKFFAPFRILKDEKTTNIFRTHVESTISTSASLRADLLGRGSRYALDGRYKVMGGIKPPGS